MSKSLAQIAGLPFRGDTHYMFITRTIEDHQECQLFLFSLGCRWRASLSTTPAVYGMPRIREGGMVVFSVNYHRGDEQKISWSSAIESSGYRSQNVTIEFSEIRPLIKKDKDGKISLNMV